MAITGHDQGRLKVLLVSDDNQNAAQTTRFLYLRVRVLTRTGWSPHRIVAEG